MWSKPFYKSKTFWFNVVAFIVAILANFGYTGEVPADWQPFILPAVIVANLILRFVTKQPIGL